MTLFDSEADENLESIPISTGKLANRRRKVSGGRLLEALVELGVVLAKQRVGCTRHAFDGTGVVERGL